MRDGSGALDRDSLAPPLEHVAVGLGPDRGRMARIDDAVELADVRQRGGRPAGDVEQLERLADRYRDHAALEQMSFGPLQEPLPTVRPAEELNRLHGHQAHGKSGLESELASVGEHGLDIEVAGAVGELREQLGVAVKRGHAMPVASQVERDPAGPGADVEHGIAVVADHRSPQLEILGVAAALEVVPDHAHRGTATLGSQNWPVTPRAASSSRSSSSAV